MVDWGKLFGRPKKTRDIHFLKETYNKFRELISLNNSALELIADLGDKLSGDYLFDSQYLRATAARLDEIVYKIVYNLNAISDRKYPRLFDAFETAKAGVRAEMEPGAVAQRDLVIGLDKLSQDLSDAAGDKMATLGELGRLGFRIPEGFVVSTFACRRFFEHNGIDAERLLDECASMSGAPLEEALRGIRENILEGALPPELKKSLSSALASLGKGGNLAVRSSALGEDGASTFAGLYTSLLNVPPDRFLSAYKEVLASLFSPQVMAYREKRPQAPGGIAMAVGAMRMVPARVSGVCYSLNPSTPEKERMVVSACWGLGKMVVEGEGGIDQFELAKSSPYEVVSRRIGQKRKKYVFSSGGGVELVPVPEEEQAAPCMSEEALGLLARTAARVESYLRCFQDIEWAMDGEGELHLLQARPLHVVLGEKRDRADVASAARKYPVLLKGEGVVACRGIAAGAVYCVTGEEDIESFPAGAVLVAKFTSPRLSKLVPKAGAIVTDVGAVTGHLATVAREFRVPTIVDAGKAMSALKPGVQVTVDAEENIVYEGAVEELLKAQLFVDDPYENAPEFRLLRRLLRRVSPLHLTNPQAKEFSPERCTTYHDIIRFAHEMAVREVARGLDARQLGGELPTTKLDLSLPLDLIVVDIGGGLDGPLGTGTAKFEDLACAPLRVLLRALAAPGVWRSEPVDLDFGGFMSSLTRTAATDPAEVSAAGQNVAIITREYMNLNLRLGYHFNMLDVYLSENRNENYIYFRFLGGVTDITRRSRRARLLASILEKQDFVVETKGDLVISRTKKMDPKEMEKRLRILGRLVGFTRQLDILLKTEESVEEHIELFERRSSSLEREEGSA